MDQIHLQENSKPVFTEHTNFWLWTNSLLFGILLFLFCLIYSLLESEVLSVYDVNTSLASTAFLLIGFSFVASSVSYFFKFNQLIVHRKYIGVLGFVCALLHATMSIFLFKFPGFFLTNHSGIPFFSGLGALIIFFIMATISNGFATRIIGGKTWRYLLRFGYIGFILTILHFLYTTISLSTSYYSNIFQELPPSELILLIFGLIVLLSRCLLQISLLIQGRKLTKNNIHA